MPASPFFRRALAGAAIASSCLLAWSAPAGASHPQAPRAIGNLDYLTEAESFFKHGDPIPRPDQAEAFFGPLMHGSPKRKFNPSGEWSAYDTNVFETLMLPFRAAGDTTTNDPYGNAPAGRTPSQVHGFCSQPHDPNARPGNAIYNAGVCPNHALEYIDYYEDTMEEILGEFGVTMKRYEFEVPEVPAPRTPLDNTLSGKTYNTAAVVPGAGHGDETVIIGAHFDQTNDGPASVWDSAEGHAQIIRVARQMAKYWKATNSRPTATVKFIPWAGEEAGVLGSADYAENNIVPGEEGKVRGYWNTDPCAGGYPAYRYGVPGERVDLGIQLARPTEVPDEFAKLRPRVTAFNAAAEGVVEDVLTHIDDTVPTTAGEQATFISKSENPTAYDYRPGGDISLGGSRPVLFSSDWRSFLAKGVPFFNPGPEITGPSDENQPNNPDGAATFHTPNDNHVTMGRYTGQPLNVAQTTAFASDGWARGMEFCASMLSWGMLRDDQGGAEIANTNVVAYYEALPNEAQVRAPLTFDAAGSHQLATTGGTRTYVPDSQLEYIWDFGDGTVGSGKSVQHAYDFAGVYKSKLTVRNTTTGASDTMEIPITVVGTTLPGPELTAPAEDEDGFYDVSWTYDTKKLEGFAGYILEEATTLTRALSDPAENIAANWTVSEPTNDVIQPWQHSDGNTGSTRGNVKHQGARSFWTGLRESDQEYYAGPDSGVSRLTLKESFQLSSDAELVYRSSFRNDQDDSGLVEVAVAQDGVGDDELDWQVVDSVKTVQTYSAQTAAGSDPKTMDLRRVDLGEFAGQRVKLRFVYTLAPVFYLNVRRTGWYIDDMTVDTGNFREIARTSDPVSKIGPRRKGTYAYRVRAFGAKDSTLPSNFARTNVTVGTDPDAKKDTTATPGGPPATPRCLLDSGFRSLKVTPRGRGLRFDFVRDGAGKVRIDVFRYYQSRRSIGRRTVVRYRDKTKSLTWNGRGRRVRNGSYYARISIPVSGRQNDVRYVSLRRKKGRFSVVRAFRGRPTCGPLRRFHLGQMVFGGKRRQGLRVIYQVAEPGTVRVELLRGKRVVKRTGLRRIVRPGTYSAVFGSKGLRGGEYRVRITAEFGGRRVVSLLAARRI